MKEAIKVECFACPECGNVYADEERALKCCQGTCERCGGPLGPRHAYCTVCRNCQDAEVDKQRTDRWRNAPKAVWGKDYDGPIFFCDNYYDEPEYILDDYDELPDTDTWACEEVRFGLDAEMIERLVEESDEAYEDYCMPEGARREIEEFCNRWNGKWSEIAQWPCRTAVIFGDESKEERTGE